MRPEPSGKPAVRRGSGLVPAWLSLALPDQEATRELGRRLAALIRPGDVIALCGLLGSGKTELARALIRARARAAIEVPSPSYTLVQDYRFPDLLIRHIDLYRIHDPAELLELGLDAPGPGEAWLIEWPERAAAVLPADRLDLELRQGAAPDARVGQLNAGPGWIERLDRLCGASGADAASRRGRAT